MTGLIIFLILSLFFIFISRKSLVNPKSHGFYRFFGWEAIAWLVSGTYDRWFLDPNSPIQLVSWFLLTVSACLIISSLTLLNRKGEPHNGRTEKELFNLEKTTKLVDTGLYKYIRHPMYSSLIFLIWGLYFKGTELSSLIIAFLATIILIVAAIVEEKECIVYFGDSYCEYMKRSKRFIPFLV